MTQVRTMAAAVIAEAWGDDAPDWIKALAARADALGSQRLAAEEIGYSSATINQVLRGRYRGDLGKVEDKVRGALLGETVKCPALGPIGKDRCHAHQDAPFAATNSMRVRLYRACRAGCPNSKIGGGS